VPIDAPIQRCGQDYAALDAQIASHQRQSQRSSVGIQRELEVLQIQRVTAILAVDARGPANTGKAVTTVAAWLPALSALARGSRQTSFSYSTGRARRTALAGGAGLTREPSLTGWALRALFADRTCWPRRTALAGGAGLTLTAFLPGRPLLTLISCRACRSRLTALARIALLASRPRRTWGASLARGTGFTAITFLARRTNSTHLTRRAALADGADRARVALFAAFGCGQLSDAPFKPFEPNRNRFDRAIHIGAHELDDAIAEGLAVELLRHEDPR
jgi:hypothetical protein